MYSTVISGALFGVQACMVQVEVDVANGLPAFRMVGSLGNEVRESKDRVLAALKNVGLDIPPMCITVNLSPADLKKEGTAYDLPIAIGLLEALGFFPAGKLKHTLFLGELGLNGEIRKTKGVLPIVQEAVRCGLKECIVPSENAREGGVIPGCNVRGADDITQVLLYLQADEEDYEKILPKVWVEINKSLGEEDETEDFSQVCGQQMAKRASEIAAAGFHNLLMTGPPGAGKSMIAKRIPGIMPSLTLEESLEVTSVYSVAGLLPTETGLITKRPFQSPHHTISSTALTGGGKLPRPGMMSLAHRGVLFLDEMTEFSRVVLDSMRQPLEERKVRIARVAGNMVYPADFMLVCAMNPCPCGFYPDRNRCRCSEPLIKRYMGKISGPLLDRIDLCVELQAVDVTGLQNAKPAESTKSIRDRVRRARDMQKVRFEGTPYRFNADIPAAAIERFCPLSAEVKECLEDLVKKLQLSARSYHRIIRVARTIADLEGVEEIGVAHVLEASCYRPSMTYWM